MSQSMTPEEAAQAFYGQDDANFADMVAKLAKNDARLVQVFKNTRKHVLDQDLAR
jgi:hypothetical protein